MIDKLKSELEDLQTRIQEVKPKIDELNAQREDEIGKINEKYDKLIDEVNSEVNKFREKVNNDLIESFIKTVMNEFDLKRSTSEYTLSDDIKEYKEYIATVDMFPDKLVQRLEKLIGGDPIENIAYDLEKIQEQFLIS